jgi:hypothetical protein
MGWEILLPGAIEAEWNGGIELSDITVETRDPDGKADKLALSHFGHGILTFPINYLFRTEPGVALWARGAPNSPKDGIAPLEGIVETDWASFTFTMNWQFTRPGRVVFEKDEPICFVTPIAYRLLEHVRPEIVPLAEAPEIAEQYWAYSEARKNFNTRLAERDPAASKEGWQKWYMRGENPFGSEGNPLHISNLRLSEPVERSDLQTAASPELKRDSTDD